MDVFCTLPVTQSSFTFTPSELTEIDDRAETCGYENMDTAMGTLGWNGFTFFLCVLFATHQSSLHIFAPLWFQYLFWDILF